MELGNGRAELVVTSRGTFSLTLRRNYIAREPYLQFYPLAFFEIETPAGQVDSKAGYNNVLLF